MPTFYIETFGCKVNQYEEQLLREQLLSLDFIEADNLPADVCVVNGCAVTSRAFNKSGKALRAMKGKCLMLVLTGCSASAFNDLDLDWYADIIVEQKDKSNLANTILDKLGILEKTQVNSISFLKGHHRAFVKVEDGCDLMCSYCYIPYLRGPEIRVRPFEEIKDELSALRDSGYNEVVFTGISLGRASFLPELICVAQNIGFPRIRLSSIEAGDISDELLTAIRDCPSACPHLHIPIQSASDSVLGRMNRPYTRARYQEIIAMCRQAVSGLAISTDIMVGFPLETDEEFRQTLDFLQEIRPMRVHAFPYSRRPKTAAFKRYGKQDQVQEAIKKERVSTIIAMAKDWANEFMDSFVGGKDNVLIERKVIGVYEGTTSHYLRINLENCAKLSVGKVYDVEIMGVDVRDRCLLGKIAG